MKSEEIVLSFSEIKLEVMCNSHSLVHVSAISETTVEVLPRLFKIKYDSGTLEELLYVDIVEI